MSRLENRLIFFDLILILILSFWVLPRGGVYGNANGITGSDLIDLNLINGSENGDKNLGNWCVQYQIPFEIKNTTGKSIVVNGFFRRFNDNGNGQVILRAENYSDTLYGMLYAGTEKTKNNSWKWFEAKIAPNDTFTGSYQYILGTYSYSRIFHMWEARFA